MPLLADGGVPNPRFIGLGLLLLAGGFSPWPCSKTDEPARSPATVRWNGLLVNSMALGLSNEGVGGGSSLAMAICGEGFAGGKRGGSCLSGRERGGCAGVGLDEKDGARRLKPKLPKESFDGFRVNDGLGRGGGCVDEGGNVVDCCEGVVAAAGGPGAARLGAGGGKKWENGSCGGVSMSILVGNESPRESSRIGSDPKIDIGKLLDVGDFSEFSTLCEGGS